MTKKLTVFILTLAIVVEYRSALALNPAGTCLVPNFSYYAKLIQILGTSPSCMFPPYDVSQIQMTVLSPQNPSTIDLITSTDEFVARGCCDKPTLFTHHGFLESKDIPWNTKLQLEHATATGGCAIAFDYYKAMQENYICTVNINVDNIGRELARRMFSLFVEPGCLASENIIFMGFSMGSPISIRSAYNLLNTYNTTIDTFYSVDSAGPLFDEHVAPPESFYYDAVVKTTPKMQCIHTSNVIGTNNHNLCPSAIITGDCHMDQPECYNSPSRILCNHITAPSFLIQSYNTPGSIVATSCPTCSIFPCRNPSTEVYGYQSGYMNLRKLDSSAQPDISCTMIIQ